MSESGVQMDPEQPPSGSLRKLVARQVLANVDVTESDATKTRTIALLSRVAISASFSVLIEEQEHR
jgi:hypothetical protein